MNRNMYTALIVVGVVLLIIGVIGISNTHSANDLKPVKDSVANTVNSPKTQKEINKEKGNDFEGYVADCFADKNVFELLEWNQGVASPSGVYAEKNTDPDFRLKQKFSDKFHCEYYVEAKYLSRWNDNNTINLNDYQINRYRDFQKSKGRKVLIAIGIGGTAASPADFYLIPLDSVSNAKLSVVDLAPFKLSNPHKNFKNYVYDYFQNEVFLNTKSK